MTGPLDIGRRHYPPRPVAATMRWVQRGGRGSGGRPHEAAYPANVSSEWLDQLRKTGATFSGGQGRAYAAEAPDGTRVFVKMLKRQGDRRARFAREAAAYETLEHPGLPAVISHNADRWRDPRATLYLGLELIEGPTLGEAVRQARLALSSAVGLTIELLRIIDFCHTNDVVHRDLKPANIVMSEKGPVVVDLGLSFNSQDSETSDLTRVNEEVGNRFLRLPEHSTGAVVPSATSRK